MDKWEQDDVAILYVTTSSLLHKAADPDPTNHRENPDPNLPAYNICGPTKLLSADVSSFLVMFYVAMRGRVAV
jgi:hypothetical protein